MWRRLPRFWELAACPIGGGGGRDSKRSIASFHRGAESWPFDLTGVSVARCDAVTDLIWSVPVLAGEAADAVAPLVAAGGSSKSCRNLANWASNCLLCSSRIFIRASNRVLCCLSNRASASMSRSTSLTCCTISSGDDDKDMDMDGDCCDRKRSYSACKLAFSSSSSRIIVSISSLWFTSRAASSCTGLRGTVDAAEDPLSPFKERQYWAINWCSSSESGVKSCLHSGTADAAVAEWTWISCAGVSGSGVASFVGTAASADASAVPSKAVWTGR